MECQRVQSLVVLTLLQLCRAEIRDGQPQWYSANIINDVFQPKSISELFTTEAPFSTANPIIVSSKTSKSLANDNNILFLSTLSPPTSLSSTTSSAFDRTSSTFPTSSLTSPFQQQYIPQRDQNQQFQQLNQPSVVFRQQSSPIDFEQVLPIQPQRNVQIQQEQFTSTQALPPISSEIQLTSFYQPQSTDATLSRGTETSLGPQSSTSRPPQTVSPLSNYFMIYQQGPQSIQNYPNLPSSPQSTAGETLTTTSSPSVTSTFASTFTSPTPTFSTSPLFFSSTTTPRVTVTSLSTIGSSSDSATKLGNCIFPKSTTPIPRLTIPNGKPIQIDGLFPLKIRVVAPSGSITSVNFNPAAKNPITTQKFIASTTTRKPTTRRTPKTRKNTYERCLQGCRKNGQSLCAAPLSQFPVDPKTLRGFPSVCHMACHNSYRKDPFEKIVDGSCGKLRTRIRPIDTNTKLKRDELQKVQYFLENSGQPAVVEVSGVYA